MSYIYMYDIYIIKITQYQVIISLLGNTNNLVLKFRTKNCVEVNDDARETYNANIQIKFKSTMLKSSLCD